MTNRRNGLRNGGGTGGRGKTLLRLRTLIACVALWAGMLPHEALPQGDGSAVQVRSIGLPPPGASALVAETGMPRQVSIAPTASMTSALKSFCGHDSPGLLEKTRELNKSLLDALGGMDVPVQKTETLILPACIRVLPTWRAEVREGEGLARLVKRELNFLYDEKSPAWAAFAQAICTLNAGLAGFSCTRSVTDPALPKNGTLKLPGAVWRSQIEVDLSKTTVDEFIGRLARELEQTSEGFFVTDPPMRAPIASYPLVFTSCPVGSRQDPVYDTRKLVRLFEAYTRPSQRLNDGFGNKISVITIIDTGIDLQNVVLGELLFKKIALGYTDGIYDSSNADVGPDDDVEAVGYPRGQFGVLSPADIIGSDKVPFYHGTHVAGLALGRPVATEPLSSDDALKPLVNVWPRLRVFRSLRRQITTGKYELAPRGLGSGLDFALDRTSRLTENNVINISMGSTGTTEMRRRLESLGNYAVVVAAAGNDGLDLATEAKEKYPAAFGGSDVATNGPLGAFVISVGALSQAGDPMALSNYSRTSVDLFSVGECQYSFQGEETDRIWLTGTSQAAPWVSLTAALVQQMPLPTKHPSYIKNRILSSVRASPKLSDKAESGGALDPLRAIDVLVDHIRFSSSDGRTRSVRALVDYGQSDKPCDGVAGLGNVARFEKRPDGTGQYRARQRIANTPPPGKVAYPTPLSYCGKISASGKVRYYLDEDFARMAEGKQVELREKPISEIEEFVSRAFEDMGPVGTVPSRPPFKAILLETTTIMAEP